ncbi:MAG: 3-methyl-2-oxobutanoate hydroxymethyltransferase [Coriobacteriia bacterium]|nr:3-methyl-2-oxobutanoate hydroxymethyltransferase [Coriobacteriia bacterium]
MKGATRRIVAITAYDVAFARLVDAAGVDVVLVGDSLGMTVLGHGSTLPVTVDDMVRHTAAVSRGVERALLVADMPFMSYQADPADALRNAGRLMAEGGAQAVKLEGGRQVAPTIERLVGAGIPVIGHVGLTPQSVHAMGGYRVQARETVTALRLLDECRALAEAGAFAVVLECIPAELSEVVTAEVAIPTIGIGAGAGCDGEVQVLHDLLGLTEQTPRHASRFAEIGGAVVEAVRRYAEQVRAGEFPAEANCTRMEPAVVEELRRAVGGREGPEE